MRGPMRVDDAPMLFESIIAAQGNSLGELAAAQAWDAFAAFALIPFAAPVGPGADGLLYEYGVFRFTGAPRFTLSLVRQFEMTVDGEHDHYIQFQCELLFEPTAELEALGSYNSWHFPGRAESVGEWLQQIRARREWELLDVHMPVARELWQTAV